MALPGIVCGAWLAREHGRSASRFLMALGTGFMLRLLLGAVTAAGAAHAGRSAIAGLLPGLAVGFLSVTSFEMLWFVRMARLTRITNETRA
jgi:lipopolysaccharide export LptBFGC system permease protein LptF